MEQIQMTKAQLKVELTKANVSFPAKATLTALQEAYDKLQGEADRKAAGINPLNNPVCDSFESPSAKNKVCMTCAAEFAKRFDACNELANAAKAGGSGKKPDAKRQTVKSKYADFAELKASIEKADPTRLTMFVDQLLVKGEKTLEGLLAAIEARKAEVKSTSTDFKNVSIIKKHMKYRASKGWVFTIHTNGHVAATDYAIDGNGTIVDQKTAALAAAAAAAAAEKKAA